MMQQLADACLVVDALDAAARDELMRSICSKELTAYQQIFQGTGECPKSILATNCCHRGGAVPMVLCQCADVPLCHLGLNHRGHCSFIG